MATLHEYFDTDFSHTVKIYGSVAAIGSEVEVAVLCDFAGNMVFLACYVPGQRRLAYFIDLLGNLEYEKTQFVFSGKVVLPLARTFHGQLRVEAPLNILVCFHGDAEWIPWTNLKASTRVFIYSESVLSDEEMHKLKGEGRRLNHEVQFRSEKYVQRRSLLERPVAFVCHDSRDKDQVARRIATNLQRMMCPVWYDEFSLEVGANLRESIERGLKECKKCILILSPYFFSNAGWTKKEFDSIFTREILEKRSIVLPVWVGVTQKAVFDYSASLANVVGLNWAQLGEDEVCRRLARVLLDDDTPAPLT